MNTNTQSIDSSIGFNVMKVCETPKPQTDEEVLVVGYVSPTKVDDQSEVLKEEMPMGFYLERLLDQIENLPTIEEITTIDEEEFAASFDGGAGESGIRKLELQVRELYYGIAQTRRRPRGGDRFAPPLWSCLVSNGLLRPRHGVSA